MKLIRNSTSEAVSLEDGFLWSDEFAWKPIEQNLDRAINGAAILQEGVKLSGRTISLVPADSDMGWIQLKDLRQVQAWLNLQEQFTLVYEWPHDNRRFNVVFNHEAGALEAKPVKGIPAVSLDDYFNLTLRFLELENGN